MSAADETNLRRLLMDGHAKPSRITALLAELDAERAAHRATLALLARVWDFWAGGDAPDDLATEIVATLAQARGSRDGVHCACGNVVGADGVRCVECAR